jgi:ribonuclease D
MIIIEMIDSEEKLAAGLLKVKAAKWIAVDTEADSLHAYPEKLCLIQVSVPDGDLLVDPLANMNFAPLLEVLQRQELILHGADYDLRLLRRRFDFEPSAIFDTMLASRLLGVREFGLTNLAQKFLGVRLEKGPQKANWGRRPLTERMAIYARNDTHYLKPLADILRQQLKDKGRLSWHQESCARLIADTAQVHAPDPESVWRVKGSHHLEPAGLAVLRELWHWREKEALRVNKPPFFILSPEVMVRLAHSSTEPEAMHECLPRHLTTHRQEGVLGAIESGLRAESLPSKVVRQISYRQSETERKRMNDLQKARNHQAAQLGIDPTLIASRAVLVLLARSWDVYAKELMQWQRELLKDGARR